MRRLLALLVVAVAGTVAHAQLPQNYQYQIDLRNYLATLQESDFQLSLQEMSYDPSYLTSNDDVHAAWLVFQQALPQHTGLRVAASHFVLSNIERDGKVYMSAGRNGFFDPGLATWWTQWDYAGNPYYGSQAVLKRSFVASAVDMIMQDRDHDLGHNRRSDYLGGNMIWWSYTYAAIKDSLPSSAQSAYETGLRKMFGKIEAWGPTGIFGDMDSFAIVGLNYAADAIGDPDLKTRAQAYTQRVFDRHYKQAGYMGHGDGFDPSYMGIDFVFLNWASRFANDPSINEVVDHSSRLKAYLTLPDADGVNFWGPTHFATATSADSANDQWITFSRDVSAAMISQDALYLLWGGRKGRGDLVKTEAEMRAEINSKIGLFNSASLATAPAAWAHNHWVGDLGMVTPPIYYPPGFYDALVALEQQNSELTKPPFSRSGNFIENFDNTFLSAKLGDFGVIIHTGRLSNWGTAAWPSGFSGGALSAFWTPEAGPAILGRSAGFQSSTPPPDTWDNWRQWATHAISGLAANGKPFSSSRQRFPQSSYLVGPNDAVVEVWGDLTGADPAPSVALTGLVTYHRTFTLTERGLTVQSGVISDGTNLVTELWEILPVSLGEPSQAADVAIMLLRVGGWIPAETSLISEVYAVRVDRFGGSIFINFDLPQSVMLSPEVWSDVYQSRMQARNIMIDLLHSGGQAEPLPSVAITYTLSTRLLIPEPATAVILLLAGVGLAWRPRPRR